MIKCKYERYVKNAYLNDGFQTPETKMIADMFGDQIRPLFSINPSTGWNSIREHITPLISEHVAQSVDWSDLWSHFSVEHYAGS